MRYINEFRNPHLARSLVAQIRREAEPPVRIMEFCGGHTHAIFRYGLRQLLAGKVVLSSGPGCPVCVTAAADLDRAIALASVPKLLLTTFGDMLRIPGSRGSLQDARAQGADVRIVYSPADAVALARENPARQVVFLGVGFETTAPGIAAAVLQAEAEGVPNFSVLSLHKLTPPAIRAVLDSGETKINAILGPGHVSAIIGSEAWRFLPEDYGIPLAVSGFEPLDILGATAALVHTVNKEGAPQLLNSYGRSVRPEGNRVAQQLLDQVFRVEAAEWRGFGTIPASGLVFREEYAHRDAARLFQVPVTSVQEPPGCCCDEVLRGVMAPDACALFRRVCSPRNPVGPCMVSAEGACAAYFQYGGDDLA